ncbi:MAG: hypothetical protein ACRDHW_24150, partial [Ktedonobacteraceae bacterium]
MGKQVAKICSTDRSFREITTGGGKKGHARERSSYGLNDLYAEPESGDAFEEEKEDEWEEQGDEKQRGAV